MLHICVKLEHAYIRNVNVRWTDRHDHRLTDHVGLAQARPNEYGCAQFVVRIKVSREIKLSKIY